MFSYIKTTLKRSWYMFVAIAKIMLPVMLLVKIAQDLGFVDWLGLFLAPVMSVMNLPPEAAIVWVTTVITSIYGGLASLATLSSTLDITVGQISALGAMMLFAHSVPVEQSVVKRAGASFSITLVLRLTTAIVYGAAFAWISKLTGWLDEPANIAWLSGSNVVDDVDNSSYLHWIKSTAFSLVLTYSVILVLVIVLDAFDKLGITRRFTTLITPILKFSGLNKDAAPVTTVGVLLGLSYGGALIIEESEKKNFSARTRFLALSWLSLSHALIEDTILILAIGANIWVILVGRVIITLLIIALLARLTLKGRFALAQQGQ